MMRRRPVVAALTVIAAAAAAVTLTAATGRSTPSGPAASATTATPLSVTGYQTESDPSTRIDASAAALDIVGVDGVTVAASGATVAAPDADARAQLARAHHDHLRAEFLVSNYTDAIGDFSERVAFRLLGNPAHRQAVVAALVRSVTTQGWDGVDVDLESLAPRDMTGLTDLLRRLRAALPSGRTLSVDLMAATSPAGYGSLGYQVRAIAATVDRVALMTYDEHGPWENDPGPVGSLVWTRQCVAALFAAGVPSDRLDLGVAGYGYAWRPHSNVTLTDAQARRLVAAQHAHAEWHPNAGEWLAVLRDGSTVWWSDARSYRVRYAWAAAHHLHGLAVWSLGQSDPITPPR